jgi:sensor histidine kinase YesM
MISSVSTSSQPPSAGTRKKAFIPTVLKRMVWLTPAIAAFCVALFLTVGETRLSETGVQFLHALLFSTLIGVPSAFLVSWIHMQFEEISPWLSFMLSALALGCTAAAGAAASILILIWVRIIPTGSFQIAFRHSFPMSLVITLVVGLSIIAYEIVRSKLHQATLELRNREIEQERANKLLAEARLSSLESRIHPHFLFNTLNSIAALIPTDPPRAEDTVGKLASLLRFSLNVNQSSLVFLAVEMKVVRDYLEIEATRFGSRLRCQINVPEELRNAAVPPLAVQTLVENVVKHVVSKLPQGASIRVTASRANGRIRVEVGDDGPGFSLQDITPEHGLGNLITRLELLFGQDGQLEVKRMDSENIVSLSFPERDIK